MNSKQTSLGLALLGTAGATTPLDAVTNPNEAIGSADQEATQVSRATTASSMTPEEEDQLFADLLARISPFPPAELAPYLIAGQGGIQLFGPDMLGPFIPSPFIG